MQSSRSSNRQKYRVVGMLFVYTFVDIFAQVLIIDPVSDRYAGENNSGAKSCNFEWVDWNRAGGEGNDVDDTEVENHPVCRQCR